MAREAEHQGVGQVRVRGHRYAHGRPAAGLGLAAPGLAAPRRRFRDDAALRPMRPRSRDPPRPPPRAGTGRPTAMAASEAPMATFLLAWSKPAMSGEAAQLRPFLGIW